MTVEHQKSGYNKRRVFVSVKRLGKVENSYGQVEDAGEDRGEWVEKWRG